VLADGNNGYPFARTENSAHPVSRAALFNLARPYAYANRSFLTQALHNRQSAMPLYWLCYRHNNSISVVIEPASSFIHARLRASIRWIG